MPGLSAVSFQQIYQLKPSRDSFKAFVLDAMKRCDVFVLCEGRSDAEVFKLLIRKLNMKFNKNIAITDCEGRDKLYEIASVLVTLKRLFRKVKSLAVVVDADSMEYEARFQS